MSGFEGHGITLGQLRDYIKDLPDEVLLVGLGDPHFKEIFYMFSTEYRLFSQTAHKYENKTVLVMQS